MLALGDLDVEGFLESNEESFFVPPRYVDAARETREIERNMDALLGLDGVLQTAVYLSVVGHV